MKKKEIVVSGLAINTSDISSSDSESEDNRSYYNSDYQFLSAGYKMPDPILTSLVQPSVRKIGGGGAVSMSAFQVSSLHFIFYRHRNKGQRCIRGASRRLREIAKKKLMEPARDPWVIVRLRLLQLHIILTQALLLLLPGEKNMPT